MKKLAAWMMTALLCAPALAAPGRIPTSPYRVDGKPVPSSCLESLGGIGDGANDPVDLTHCGDPTVKPEATPDGMIGYDTPDNGFFHYRYAGRIAGIDILYFESSGGGSGVFTQLIGIRRDGHMLRPVKTYAGGDRCNGGVSNAMVKNQHLTFDQAITPHDLMTLAHPDTRLKAYEDLEASAASCIGVSHMAGDDKHWTGVTLDKDAGQDQSDWTKNYKYQACFNALYRQTVARGQAELDRTAVMAFAEDFTRRCVRSKS